MKSKRQEAILKLIAELDVKTQDELRSLLRERGFDVTQATLSRDIAQLGIVKDDRYIIPEKYLPLPPLSMSSVTGADYAHNTVVIRCRAGTANAVCAEIDSLDIKNAVGTIAGDDTIFMLMRTEKDAANICREISGQL
ncbi:MAG: hypothetical protein J6I96_07520 [Oscillospiraceae bacterium]|nr:hypothetical protein [Oscillospiraceae bacterium]